MTSLLLLPVYCFSATQDILTGDTPYDLDFQALAVNPLVHK